MRRYLIFIIGLFINSTGVCLITKADLGTSPTSAIPYTLSLGFPLSMGTFTIAFNLLLIVLQIILYRKEFEKKQYFQIAAAVVFGYFLDLILWGLSWLTPQNIIVKLLVLLAGCAVLGLGVSLEVRADAIMLPGEGFVKALSAKTGREFGQMKVCSDATMTVIALFISLLLFHQIRGVGAGTVIAAFLTGAAANLFSRILEPSLSTILPREKMEKEKESFESSGNTLHQQIIITIGREYGCGASLIGKKVAEKLGISFYDSELVDMAAEASGLTTEYILKNEERLTNSFLYDIYMQTYAYTSGEESKRDIMRHAQETVIKKITEKESCVLMGRAANYVLAGNEKAFHVFLYAPTDFKVRNVMERESLARDEAEKKISRVDQERRNNYRQYARKEWGMADCYDLTVNTGLYTAEKVADIIVEMYLSAARDIGQDSYDTAH